MFRSLSYVTLSKVIIISAQLIFLLVFSHQLPVEDLGQFSFALAITTPIAWILILDAPSRIIANTYKNNNLLIILALGVIGILLQGIYVASTMYYSANNSHLSTIILFILIMKLGEVLSEVEYATLRKEEKFKPYSIAVSIRHIVVYGSGIIVLLYGGTVLYLSATFAILSGIFAIISFYHLLKNDWVLHFNYCETKAYILNNANLGLASGIKFFSSNLMKYFVVYQYGLVTLGSLTPIFYGLTALSNISTIFDAVLSPRIVKKINSTKTLDFSLFKHEVIILASIAITIFMITLLVSKYYYYVFFPNNSSDIHQLLIIFSIGWLLYVFRGIFRIVSYSLGLQFKQIFIQIIFACTLLITMPLFIIIFEINGIALSFVFANLVICLYYYNLIRTYTSIL